MRYGKMEQEKTVEITIKGKAPLLQHRFPEEEHGEHKVRKKTQNYDPKEEAKKALYLDEKGMIYQPAEHIQGALVKAGVSFKFEGKKTYKDLMKSGIIVEPDAIPLHKKTWDEIDKRPVVINRARVIRYRPMFNEWELTFRITVLDESIALPLLKEILDYAGNRVGIGDYRPKFGRFIVTKFEELKEEK
jgi:hypothetical protein